MICDHPSLMIADSNGRFAICCLATDHDSVRLARFDRLLMWHASELSDPTESDASKTGISNAYAPKHLWQNLALVIVLAVASYLSAAAIAALPDLLEDVQSSQADVAEFRASCTQMSASCASTHRVLAEGPFCCAGPCIRAFGSSGQDIARDRYRPRRCPDQGPQPSRTA